MRTDPNTPIEENDFIRDTGGGSGGGFGVGQNYLLDPLDSVFV